MIVAKLIAITALTLFLAGAAGAGGSAAIAASCVLFLVAAVIGAVVLEGRDLEPAAALLPHATEEAAVAPAGDAATVVDLPTAA